MTLLAAGYWHTTYWANNYWQQDYWLEYGTAAPPAPSAGGFRGFYRPPQPRLNPELIRLLKEWLELKIAEST